MNLETVSDRRSSELEGRVEESLEPCPEGANFQRPLEENSGISGVAKKGRRKKTKRVQFY